MYADIIVPVPLPLLFTYEIPEHFRSNIAVGSRVIVSFGRKRLLSGVIYSLHNKRPENYDVKPILDLLDDKPVVISQQLRLWEWIADYYQCTLGEVYKAALPAGLKMESETRVSFNKDFAEEEELTPRMREILYFVEDQKQVSIQKINEFIGIKDSYPTVKKLMESQALIVHERIESSYRPKKEAYITLHPTIDSEDKIKNIFNELERAPKQLHVMMFFIQKCGGVNKALKGNSVLKKELNEAVENGANSVSALVKRDFFIIKEEIVSRLDQWNKVLEDKKPLSDVQQIAFEDVKNGFAQSKPVLLYGVTSSGKTEIYIHLIEEALKSGKQALYLLPEIALTTQITSRLKAHFGDKLGIYHSKFSDSERVEVWQNLLNNEGYQVILGVRSSIFLPFNNLGLIIVDEEHESSFKQYDPAPRYNARNVALVMAHMLKSDIVLGTATPSIETYNNAMLGKYHLVELTQRHEGIALPDIEIVDLLDARRRKIMTGTFSNFLIDKMRKALQNKEQVILFQNRRGFAPYLECTACAHSPRCKHCDVNLTYHKNTNQLVCHYCGFTIPNLVTCQACGSPALEFRGFGTQKVEEEISEIFPDAKVARMDLDTTRSRSGYESIITDFELGKSDILVGTQMVTKGLDFDKVSLVGILNADSMFNSPDFRAFERSFQMMSQVSGRAGRKHKQGTVVLQTSNANHPIIEFVKNNDFKGFYDSQIEERETFNYPPFYRLINITVRHKSQYLTQEAAQSLASVLISTFGQRVLGPQAPPINRIQDMFLQKILLKLEREISITKSKEIMQNAINHIISQQKWRYVSVQVDVDPL